VTRLAILARCIIAGTRGDYFALAIYRLKLQRVLQENRAFDKQMDSFSLFR